MWKNFVQWGLDAIAKIVAQKIALAITASVSPSLANAAGNSFSASGNPLSTLFNLAGGGGGGGGGLGGLFGGLAGSGFNLGASAFTSAATDAAWGSALAEGATTLSASFGAAAAAMIPVVGWIAAAGMLIYSFIQANKEPAQVKGQLQISPGTTGFEDNQFTTTKGGLNIGFNDANTQQFSGQVGLTLDKLVQGAIDAFDSRFSKEQSDHFAEVLKTMTFDAFEGTFTTEDFLQKYGGQVLQQVVSAAFNILDPALGAVEAGFKGTADEVGTFTNTLLSIYDASKGFSDTFKANIVGALSDSTQASADKVNAFLTIVNAFGHGLDPISVTLQGLSSTDIPAFIDALGGASAAINSMTFLFNNFYTTGQRAQQATAQLNADFAALGITQIPQTHAAFLKLLDSFDLTTEAGRQAYASLVRLAPLFVEVHGTADQAAGSLDTATTAIKSLGDAAHDLAGTDLQSARDFFNQNFLTPQEQANARIIRDTFAVIEATNQWSEQLHALGYGAIPTTTAGFRALYDAAVAAYGADSDFVKGLLLTAPAIVDMTDATTSLSNSATTAATNISAAADTINSIAYPDTLSVAQKFIQKFTNQLTELVSHSTGDLGDKAAIELPLIQAQIDSINKQIANAWLASGGQFNTTIETLQQELSGLTDFNDTLSKQLAQFTVLKAQYGAQIAQQLVDLQAWYDTQAHALRGNAAALTALQTIFKQQWDAIIAGTSTGVGGAIDQLDKLRQAILDYANALSLGSLSPLAPQEKFTEALSQYQAELAKAKNNDPTALGDITKFADTLLTIERGIAGSSSAYTDLFVKVQQDLRDLGAPTPATGPGSTPIPTTVVTSDGTPVATSADQQATNDLLSQLMAKLDALSTAERQAIVGASVDLGDRITTDADKNAKKIADTIAVTGSKPR
jgi:hypothetical protein